VEELRKANGLSAQAVLKAGDSLYLPKSATAGAAGAAPKVTASVPSPTTTTTLPPANRVAPLPGATASAGKAADPRAGWPASGETRYLDGKLRGVLISAAAGSPVKAVSSGTVVSAGAYRGYGLVAFVEGRTGHIYVYGGLESLGVQAGDPVSPGGLIGKVGIDRASGSPGAWFFVFKDGAALDPALAPRG
jgi:septal ring factor EnvC (AmiA/AmiB activator)